MTSVAPATTWTPARLRAWRRRAIGQMGRSRRATLALLATLPPTALRAPRTQGAWSIADVLAHIAAWEAEGARRLELIARGRGDRLRFFDTLPEVDRFNARAVRAARGTGRRALDARLAGTRARLLAALTRLPPEALAEPTHELAVVTWLREFAWTHEGAHRRAIRAWGRARATRVPDGRHRKGGRLAP